MKKIITTVVLVIGLTVIGSAQGTKKVEEESNCYTKWAQKFQDRGAEEVVDGSFADVIISIRNGGMLNAITVNAM